MRTSLFALCVIVVTGLGTGCVSQRKYDDLQELYRKSQEQVVDLQTRIAELEEQIRGMDPGADADRIAQLTSEKQRLQQQLSELQAKYDELAAQPPKKLPEPLDAELREFAENNPDIVEFDSARGMVKFKSDITFKLGSADVTDKASSTIARLAEILRGPVASNYEVRVVGHTDSVPIKRAATKQEHPTNWHLAVHRAIGVRDALDEAGAPAVRTSVSGYSKYRPVVQNTASGAEPNRRVEVYLVPMTSVNRDYITPVGGGSAQPRRQGSGDSGDSGGSNKAPSSQRSDIPLK